MGYILDPVSEAVISWLTNQAMTSGQRGLVRLLRGDTQQSALRKIAREAIERSVTEIVTEGDRCVVRDALLLHGPGEKALAAKRCPLPT